MAIGNSIPPHSAAGRFQARGTFRRTPPTEVEDNQDQAEEENQVSTSQQTESVSQEASPTTVGPPSVSPVNQSQTFVEPEQTSLFGATDPSPIPTTTGTRRRGRPGKSANTNFVIDRTPITQDQVAFSVSAARARLREIESMSKELKGAYIEAQMKFQAAIAPLREEHDQLNRAITNWMFDV